MNFFCFSSLYINSLGARIPWRSAELIAKFEIPWNFFTVNLYTVWRLKVKKKNLFDGWWLLNRELQIETFSGWRQLQPDVTSSFVGYCACSCSPPCCRGPVGDVKLVCLALWRKREYLTFIQSGLLRLATKILQIIVRKLCLLSLSHISSSISKLCHLNLLHLWMFLCFMSQGQDPTWQTANRKWALHEWS